jgi:GH35 family endo-1,4-beta-xylanase
VLFCVACIFLLSLVWLGVATGARERSLPSVSGDLILTDASLERFTLMGRQHELATSNVLEVSGQPFRKVLRVSTLAGAKCEWHAQLVTKIDAEVKNGDVLLARFWMRCNQSVTGKGSATFVYEMATPEFDKAAEVRLAAGEEWTECFVPFRAARDFPSGEARVCFRVGYDDQTIELGGLLIVNYGQSVELESLPRTCITYGGRRTDAAWRRAALARIEKHRKADLSIRVVDASGKPVPDARLHIQQTCHAFHFGSCIATDALLDPSAAGEKYRQIIEQNFNWAVFENDMKWQALADGLSPRVDQALEWLRSRSIDVRGHNLFWPGWRWLPPSLREHANSPARLREIARKHVMDVVGHYKGKLPQWDVVNEPYTNHDLIDLLGGPGVMADWFHFAHQADPDCKLFLNDYGILEGGPEGTHAQHFYDAIKTLKTSGAPIHGIGIQSHFGAALPSPMQVLLTLDKFSELGLPIELTELSLNLDDRELQADYLRDFLIAAFSHPNVNGIMLWGFWEKRHWRPQSALFDADWSIRPHGQAWMDLGHSQWRTDVRSSTDADGQVQLRGFLGKYIITALVDGQGTRREFDLTSSGGHLTLVC